MRPLPFAALSSARAALERIAGRLSASFGVAAIGVVGMLVGVAPARAADPNVTVTVEAVPDTVTFSRPALTPPMPTYAAYKITVKNSSTNVLNSVRFTGTTTVVLGSPEARSAPFRESIDLGCTTTNAARTSIECEIGTLRGGGGANATASFVVYFDAPSSVAVPCPLVGCDHIAFATSTFYSEGARDAGGASHVDVTHVLATTNLGTPTVSEIRSAVPTGGGRFFTGADGVPRSTTGDLWTTTVNVPSLVRDGARVFESTNPASCSADVTTCFFTDLTILGTFAELTITLRRDASTIAKSARIANAVIFYRHLASDPLVAVPACTATLGPLPGKPCMSSRTEYTKRSAPTPDLVGDWEFVIRAVDNGRFAG